jgi:hypothetical protein
MREQNMADRPHGGNMQKLSPVLFAILVGIGITDFERDHRYQKS